MTPERESELRELLTRGVIPAADALKEYQDGVIKLHQEVKRLRESGTPGVMHEVDCAFYKLMVSERDALRHIVNRIRQELKEVKDAAAHHDRFLLHLVDVVWNEMTESEEVPASDWVRRIITKAKESMDG